MFIATVINFLLASLNTGTEVAIFIVFIRNSIVLNIEYSLAEKLHLVLHGSQQSKLTILGYWSQWLPVSSSVSPLHSVSIHARWRYCPAISSSFGGLGPSSEINSSYRLCCGLEPWVNIHRPGSRSLLLNLYTPRVDPRQPHMDIKSLSRPLFGINSIQNIPFHINCDPRALHRNERRHGNGDCV